MLSRGNPLFAALAAIMCTSLAACGFGGAGYSSATAPTPPGSAAGGAYTMQGSVRSGAAVIGGATITAYAAGNSPQAAPKALAQTQSDAAGNFSLSFNCGQTDTASVQVYLTASGGSAGLAAGTDNAAILLVAMSGACAGSSVVTISEFTTVVAAYALNNFIFNEQIFGAAPGLPNAVATAARLADSVTGELAESMPSAAICSSAAAPNNCEAVEKINTLAAVLSACASSASSGSSACQTFFSCATPGAVDSASGSCALPANANPPINTWQAILSIARNPGLLTGALLLEAAVAAKSYSPFPAVAPNDWTLSLTYSGGGLSQPTTLAIDAAGNIWVANYNNAVTELSPTGVALSPASGYSGGGLQESFGLAIDSAGHVWVCNEQGAAAGSARGSITELAADGTVLSGDNGFAGGSVDFPESVAIGLDGHVWVGNFGNSTLTELDANGAVVSAPSGGGMSFPVALTVDQAGDLWIANQGADQLSEFSAGGVALSPNAGFMGGGLSVPQGIAIDEDNNIWVANYFGDSVSEFNDQGIAISPNSGFSGGGIVTPGGIAIDGAGRVWIASYEGGALSELTGARDSQAGVALSPPAGFKSGSLLQAFAVAIDPSGDVWVSNFGNDSVTEFIGVAVPVATPLIGLPAAP